MGTMTQRWKAIEWSSPARSTESITIHLPTSASYTTKWTQATNTPLGSEKSCTIPSREDMSISLEVGSSPRNMRDIEHRVYIVAKNIGPISVKSGVCFHLGAKARRSHVGRMRLTAGQSSAALYPPRRANGLRPSMVVMLLVKALFSRPDDCFTKGFKVRESSQWWSGLRVEIA
mmetsp:Transcript_23991/g.42966  ORF Transcript_23991/g.42966 Transcript_23991/m.42966 type:complete len:174 (+) Transcript_23991:531-1052(+)